MEDKVLEILSETLKVPKENIKHEDKLENLVTDSIQLFELLIRFEKELGTTINYDDVAHIESVGDIITYANSRVGSPSLS